MTPSRTLDNVQKKGKVPAKSTALSVDKRPPELRQSSTYSYSNGERKIIDPVVARLKEARRLEREKKEREAREKKGLPAKQAPKKPKAIIPLRQGPSKPKTTGPKSNAKPNPIHTATPVARPKPTKMNFNDLMKKASSIDQSKLSISYKAKSKSPDTERRLQSPARGLSKSPYQGSRNSNLSQQRSRPNSSQSRPMPPPPPAQERAPLPTRGPSATLAQKLKGKPKQPGRQANNQDRYDEYEEDDDDLDSFIASDEEQDLQEEDYDRDEIWAMFNRGKSRSHFQQYDDYDSDDMEATGAEIFDEESKSKRRAEIEDRKEMEEEQRRAQLKKQRKMMQK